MNLNIKGENLGNVKLNEISNHNLTFDCIYDTQSIKSIKVSCPCIKILNIQELTNKQFIKDDVINIQFTLDTNRKRLGDNNVIMTITTINNDKSNIVNREQIYDIIIKSKIVL